MTGKLIKPVMYVIFLIISASYALAGNMTISELIESYDYDFMDGTINVTSFDDYMTDRDSDGLNDTLTINLTTNASSATAYLFIVSLNEEADSVKNYTNKTVSSSDPSAQVNFDTKKLGLNRYNYTVELRRQDYSLAYMKGKTQTKLYGSYEQGVSVISVSDQSINNNFIRITLNLNVTENQTVNVTAYLAYNNRSVSATEEKTLTVPSQSVNISFDNETIKSTHYNGIYSLESVKVGDKILDTNYNTSSYIYADFAKTSYIQNIVSGSFDNNSNNLSEALQFNFTLNVTSADTYTIEAALYDSSDNYVTVIAKNSTLSTGIQTVVAEVAGKNIYSTYHDGEFKLSFARLSVDNDTKDVIYDAHTTNVTYYSDFERPKLPDLAITMNVSFSQATNITDVVLNVTNLGEAAAFNVIVDVFDNNTFENKSATDYLAVNESKIFTFPVLNTTDSSLFVAIADFDNLVDESNESNNFVDNQVTIIALNVLELSEIYSLGTYKIFELVIENNGSVAVNNVTWALNLGDGVVVNSTFNASLSSAEAMFVYLEHNYSVDGDYTVTANATAIADDVSAVSTLQVSTSSSTLSVNNLSAIYSNTTEKVFGFVINSSAANNVSVNWSLDFGDGNVINSGTDVNLTPNEQLFVYAEHDYASQGDYTVTATAHHGTNTVSSSISVEVVYLDVSNLSVINISGTSRTLQFIVNNLMPVNLPNVSWSFDTGSGFRFNSTANTTLITSEDLFVFVNYNYGTTGSFTVNASARNNSLSDYEVLNVTIT